MPGIAMASGTPERFLQRVTDLNLLLTIEATLSPVRKVAEVLDQELAQADAQCEALIANDSVVQRLTTCPSIGAITATAFVAAVDDVRRLAGRRGAARSPVISAWCRGSTAPGNTSNEAE